MYDKLEAGIRGIGCKLCQLRQELLKEDERIQKGAVSVVVVEGSGVQEGLKRE